MCEINTRRKRGMVMILVLVLVALLLIVALAIITGANNASASATAISVKYRVLNAAEGAENVALNDVATNPGEKEGTHLTGTLNGVAYDAWVLANNLLGGTPEVWTDPATGKSMTIPPQSAYLYGTASDNGGRTTFVEAIAKPIPPLKMPPGAMNAGNDILDLSSSPINADPMNPNDADLRANVDILGSASPVQGNTFAGGQDQLPGADTKEHPNMPPPVIRFPTAAELNEATRTARLSAQSGLEVTAQQVEQGGTFTGNVYVDGNLVLNQGTVTFTQGTYVYINGNLCVSGTGTVANANLGTTEFVVAGTVEVSGSGKYGVSPNQNALTMILGSDKSETACSPTNLHALDLQVNGPTAIGTLYAPNGSIDLTGAGSIIGAVDAGSDVRFEGTNAKGSLQYDATQATTTLNTGTLTYTSYIEY